MMLFLIRVFSAVQVMILLPLIFLVIITLFVLLPAYTCYASRQIKVGVASLSAFRCALRRVAPSSTFSASPCLSDCGYACWWATRRRRTAPRVRRLLRCRSNPSFLSAVGSHSEPGPLLVPGCGSAPQQGLCGVPQDVALHHLPAVSAPNQPYRCVTAFARPHGFCVRTLGLQVPSRVVGCSASVRVRRR
jgi:hypothetical protein